jgi:hypothetical protein
MKPLILTPKEEAYMICYIALYYNCDKKTCWKSIAHIIKKYGTSTSKLVYRGQSQKGTIIKNTTPFISTSPNKQMAELFVERNWSLPEESNKIGHLFTIHLKNTPWLSTRNIQYTFTDSVKEELRKINKDRLIEKGDEKYTFDEFFPRIKSLIDELVFADETQNGEEILVLNGGTFYCESTMKTKGFKPINSSDFETWYTFQTNNKTNNKTRKNKAH